MTVIYTHTFQRVDIFGETDEFTVNVCCNNCNPSGAAAWILAVAKATSPEKTETKQITLVDITAKTAELDLTPEQADSEIKNIVSHDDTIRTDEHADAPYDSHMRHPLCWVAALPVTEGSVHCFSPSHSDQPYLHADVTGKHCRQCLSDRREHQLFQRPAGVTGRGSTWGPGIQQHYLECSGCGAKNGPWVPASVVGGGW